MINQERIKHCSVYPQIVEYWGKAEANIRVYLRDKLIEKRQFEDLIFQTYMRNYKESILLAEKTFQNKDSNLWTIVISYYSMFYISNAVIYKLGYKVGDKIAHKITADALIVYVRNKLKNNLLEEYEQASSEALAISENLIGSFDAERIKRSKFQYETTEEIKSGKAKTSFERARKFGFEMEKLLSGGFL